MFLPYIRQKHTPLAYLRPNSSSERTQGSAAVDFVHELFECGDGTLHLFRIDAVRHTEVAGHAETVGWHENQVVILGLHAERIRIILKRLPVRLTFDNNYFNALYQGIPMGGYTKMVEHLLEGIEVRLGIDYLEQKEELKALAEKTVYTGAIDAYFDYSLGALEYRSVRFETELLDTPNFQGNAAVNYTDAQTPWTRIIEHKWFEFGKDDEGHDLPKTVISREYSSEWKPGDEPYYPVNDEKNGALYQKYKELAEKEKNVIFGGRLGEYKYYDMDAVIASALEMCEKELG